MATETSVGVDETIYRRVLAHLERAERIVLTTHVNADGDGAGSEAALAAWLARRGKAVTILNPTPFPETYRHLLDRPDRALPPNGRQGRAALDAADLIVVLDTGEPRRIGRLKRALERRPVVVIDHHPPGESAIQGVALCDPGACATGELLYDLLRFAAGSDDAAAAAADDDDEAWPPEVAEGLYTAIVTDTGSFRFSNTSARAHRITADLIERGVDPEAVYRRLFATVPPHRLELLRVALGHLEVDPEMPITWITIPPGAMEELGAESEDVDGIIDHARSVRGTEVALLFRQVKDGSTKVSLRSNGDVDVNAIARRFGGGGHIRASGALIGEPLDAARGEVLDAVRDVVRALERGGDSR
ncbi:MAG: DHH family phosphoesterase [Gemmatimonadota bacterium]